MKPTYLLILALIYSGIIGRKPADGISCQDIEWDSLLKISRVHGISGLICKGIRVSGCSTDIPDAIYTQLKADFMRDIRTDRFQQAELAGLFEIFEENSVDYLPLKGTVMKEYYDSTALRTMSDADVMIRISQYNEISMILKNLGYVFINESSHEIVWQKDRMTLELHKVALDPKYSKVTDSFSSLFDLGTPVQGTFKYVLDATQQVIYAISHLAKHLVAGGARLRSFIDIYYLINDTQYDSNMTETALAQVGLKDFFNLIVKTLNQWQGGNFRFDEESELLICSIMGESTDYSREKWMSVDAARRAREYNSKSILKKTRYIIYRLFPPIRIMKIKFAVLIDKPYLLPFYWIWRIVKFLFSGKKTIEQVWDVQINNNPETIDRYMSDMRALHLDKLAIPEEL